MGMLKGREGGVDNEKDERRGVGKEREKEGKERKEQGREQLGEK